MNKTPIKQEKKKLEKQIIKKEIQSELPESKQKRKVKKALAGKPGEMILRQSKYFKTIADPFNYRGVQIPDLCMYPSTSFSITDRRQVIVNANGSCYVYYGNYGKTGQLPIGSLVPTPMVSGGANNYVVGMFSNSSATTPYVPTTDLFPSGGAVANESPIYLQNWSTGVTAIQNLFDKVRLVSAGVAIDYTGTDFDNAGTITSVFMPRLSSIKHNMNASIATPISYVQSLPQSIVVPVNKNKGATVLYRPQDMRSLDYTNIQFSVDDSSAATIEAQQETLGGELLHVVTGATVGKVFQITSTFNYEGIPLLNATDIFQPQTSKSDPLELSATFNALEYVSPQSIGTDQALGKNHSLLKSGSESSAVEHSLEPESTPSVMDTIMNGIDTGLRGVE